MNVRVTGVNGLFENGERTLYLSRFAALSGRDRGYSILAERWLFCFMIRLDNRQPIPDNRTHTSAESLWSGLSFLPQSSSEEIPDGEGHRDESARG
jgi:hypothetical protein